MSPERLNSGQRLTPPMDIYSFGMLWLTVRIKTARDSWSLNRV
jgi:hypothetical protein